MNFKYYFVALIFFVASCKKENQDFSKSQTKLSTYKITESDLEVYQKCLDSIVNTHLFKTEKAYVLDTTFAHSSLMNNFGDYLYENDINRSIKDKTAFKEFLSLIDAQINDINCPNSNLNLKIPFSLIKPNTLVSFSKPNPKYITAYMADIYWDRDDNYIVDNGSLHFMIFQLKENEIKDYYNTWVIFN